MRRVKIYLYGWSVFSFYQGMVRTMIIMSFSKRTSVLRRPWDPVGAVTSKPPAKGFLFPNRCSRLPSSLDRERKRFYAWSFISIPHSGWVKIPSHDCALIVAFDFNRLAVKSIKKHFRLKQIVKKPTRRNAILDLVLITLHIFYDEPLSSPSSPIFRSGRSPTSCRGFTQRERLWCFWGHAEGTLTTKKGPNEEASKRKTKWQHSLFQQKVSGQIIHWR